MRKPSEAWNWDALPDHVRKALDIPIGETANFVMEEEYGELREYELTHTHSVEITIEQYERLCQGEAVEDVLWPRRRRP